MNNNKLIFIKKASLNYSNKKNTDEKNSKKKQSYEEKYRNFMFNVFFIFL